MFAVLVTLALCINIYVGFLWEERGRITPMDPYCVFGEEIDLTCTADDVNASNVDFYLHGIKVPSTYTTVIGDHALLCRLPITAEMFSPGHNTIECVQNTCTDCDTLATSTVFVEYAVVHNVTDIRCVIDITSREIRCTWSLGQYLQRANVIKVNFFVSINSQSWFECTPIQGENNQSCRIREDDGISIRPMSLQFKLNVTNIVRNVTKEFLVVIQDSESIVKPERVRNIKVGHVTSKAANLSWGFPDAYPYQTRVSLVSKWNKEAIVLDLKEQGYITITDLIPYTVYNGTVRIRPTIGPFYSDEVNISCVTEADLPEAPPELSPGGFHTDAHTCSTHPRARRNDVPRSRNVTIYWKRIPVEHHNGPNLSYMVSYIPESDPAGKQDVVVMGNQYSALLTLECQTSYIIEVKAGNVKGFSPVSNKITVPEFKDTKSIKEFLVQVSDDMSNVNISWKTDVQYTIYTVFWCPASYTLEDCTSEVLFTCFNAESTNHIVLNSSVTGEIGRQKFGLSLQTALYSSGITWEKCRHRQNSTPSTPKDVHVSETKTANGLVVRWSTPDCDRKKGYTQSYRLMYCRVWDEGFTDCKTKEFPKSPRTEYTVMNLLPNQNYSVQIQALSPLGRGSPFTEPVTSFITMKEMKSEASLAWITGVVLGGVVGCILIVFMYKRCKKAVSPYPIDIPIIEALKTVNFSQSVNVQQYQNGAPEFYRVSYSQGDMPLPDNVYEELDQSYQVDRKLNYHRKISRDSGTGSLGTSSCPPSPTKQQNFPLPYSGKLQNTGSEPTIESSECELLQDSRPGTLIDSSKPVIDSSGRELQDSGSSHISDSRGSDLLHGCIKATLEVNTCNPSITDMSTESNENTVNLSSMDQSREDMRSGNDVSDDAKKQSNAYETTSEENRHTLKQKSDEIVTTSNDRMGIETTNGGYLFMGTIRNEEGGHVGQSKTFRRSVTDVSNEMIGESAYLYVSADMDTESIPQFDGNDSVKDQHAVEDISDVPVPTCTNVESRIDEAVPLIQHGSLTSPYVPYSTLLKMP